jgi:prepilin-type N-terminal cleavage/methylation domain-containing protein
MKNRTQNSEPRTQNLEFKIQGFTLIEMLTVIAVIAILVGILYPALRSIRDGPKKAAARADIRKLQMAIQSYYNEYGKYPPTPRNGATPQADWFYAMLNGNRFPADGSALASGYEANNPRGIRFMDFPKKQINGFGEFTDPWNNPYLICIDNGDRAIGTSWIGDWWGDINAPGGSFDALKVNDGMIMTRTSGTYGAKRTIAVYCFGPNGTNEDAQGPEYDDITSWY